MTTRPDNRNPFITKTDREKFLHQILMAKNVSEIDASKPFAQIYYHIYQGSFEEALKLAQTQADQNRLASLLKIFR